MECISFGSPTYKHGSLTDVYLSAGCELCLGCAVCAVCLACIICGARVLPFLLPIALTGAVLSATVLSTGSATGTSATTMAAVDFLSLLLFCGSLVYFLHDRGEAIISNTERFAMIYDEKFFGDDRIMRKDMIDQETLRRLLGHYESNYYFIDGIPDYQDRKALLADAGQISIDALNVWLKQTCPQDGYTKAYRPIRSKAA